MSTTCKISCKKSENVYVIIEGERGGNGRVLRVFSSATACLAAFDSYAAGTVHFTKLG